MLVWLYHLGATGSGLCRGAESPQCCSSAILIQEIGAVGG